MNVIHWIANPNSRIHIGKVLIAPHSLPWQRQ
jgi:hypothetical protein